MIAEARRFAEEKMKAATEALMVEGGNSDVAYLFHEAGDAFTGALEPERAGDAFLASGDACPTGDSMKVSAYERAIECYTQCGAPGSISSGFDAKMADVHKKAAVAFLISGRVEPAANHLASAGESFVRAGRDEAAKGAFADAAKCHAALKAFGRASSCWWKIGDIHFRARDYTGAMESYRRGIAVLPYKGVHYQGITLRVALCLVMLKDPRGASALLRDAAEEDESTEKIPMYPVLVELCDAHINGKTIGKEEIEEKCAELAHCEKAVIDAIKEAAAFGFVPPKIQPPPADSADL